MARLQDDERGKPRKQFVSHGAAGRDPPPARRYQLVGRGGGRAVNDPGRVHVEKDRALSRHEHVVSPFQSDRWLLLLRFTIILSKINF